MISIIDIRADILYLKYIAQKVQLVDIAKIAEFLLQIFGILGSA